MHGKITPVKQPVVAHEIGHLIGLKHIGEIRGEVLCVMAIWINQHKGYNIAGDGPQQLLLDGKKGYNTLACYGELGSPGVGLNIMGVGDRFSDELAKPWRDRIAIHTSTKAADWKVSRKEIKPGPV